MHVLSIDWKPFEGVGLVKDIAELSITDIPFIPDIVWASPDCTTYSLAAIGKHRRGIAPKSEYAKKCDAVNSHFIGLIRQWLEISPKLVFFIENPRGMMRKMPFVHGLERYTVWYCQYGDDRAKPTDIWTNSRTWDPRRQCFNQNRFCHHDRAPRGSATGTQGRKNSFEKSRIPKELVVEILQSTKNSINEKVEVQASLFN